MSERFRGNLVLEENLNAVYHRQKNIDEILRFTYLDNVVIKPNAVVRYSTRVAKKKKYNAKSLANLVQYEGQEVESKKLEVIRKQGKIENINEWAKDYIKEYEAKKGKKYKRLASKQVANKVYRTASVSVRSILSRFESVRGFRQRSISFCTFTLTEPQKASDSETVRMFVEFIDHLKKVNNYIIDPITKQETREKALRLEHYFWRAETQENGNIHFHLLADCFLNQHMLRRVWNGYLQSKGYKYGYGAANVNSLKRDKNTNKIKDVEKYLCKYMTKPPLRDKYKGMKLKDLEGISDAEKYRRPVLCKDWGCSRKLLKMEYPKFYGTKVKEVVDKMKKRLKEIKMEQVPDYISVLVGDTRKALREEDYILQKQVKEHYEICHSWLYWDVPCLN